jgi:hypothetical protein
MGRESGSEIYSSAFILLPFSELGSQNGDEGEGDWFHEDVMAGE